IVLPKGTSPGNSDLSLVKDPQSEDYLILGAGPNVGKCIFRVKLNGRILDSMVEEAANTNEEGTAMRWPTSVNSEGLEFPVGGFIIPSSEAEPGKQLKDHGAKEV